MEASDKASELKKKPQRDQCPVQLNVPAGYEALEPYNKYGHFHCNRKYCVSW